MFSYYNPLCLNKNRRCLSKFITLILSLLYLFYRISVSFLGFFSVSLAIRCVFKGDTILFVLCSINNPPGIKTLWRRRRYVSNETPNDVSMERREDVSMVRLHDVLLEVIMTSQNDVTTTSHHYVSTTSQTSLK